METIKEAKAHLRANYQKGVNCPCCDQFVKMYKRKLNSGMALFLIGLYKLYQRDFKTKLKCETSETLVFRGFYQNKEVFEMMNIKVTSLDYSVLKHFKLIEPRVSEGSKKDSGYWRITNSGTLFVQNLIPSSKHVYIYNNTYQGCSEEEVGIYQVLGDKFNYEELMKA
jgi:hypothetical protein